MAPVRKAPVEKENHVQDGGRGKGKKEKDPNAPKKPVTSFLVYSAEMRPIVREEYPELKVTEVAKELGKRWKELSDGEKKPYKVMADAEKAKYTKAMAAYEKSLGGQGR